MANERKRTHTFTMCSYGSYRLSGSIAAIASIGLVLAVPQAVQAATLHGGGGDVGCLLAVINQANGNGQKNTIRLEAGSYTLTNIDNSTDGGNGLPSITSTLRIEGAGADMTTITRTSDAPQFRLMHVAANGDLTLEGVTLSG